jgi:hypothetical protein
LLPALRYIVLNTREKLKTPRGPARAVIVPKCQVLAQNGHSSLKGQKLLFFNATDESTDNLEQIVGARFLNNFQETEIER